LYTVISPLVYEIATNYLSLGHTLFAVARQGAQCKKVCLSARRNPKREVERVDALKKNSLD
jgi:hypothetical protein